MTQNLDLGIRVTTDAWVLGDYDLLKQMLLNLLDNSIKFTPDGGSVTISLDLDKGWAVLGVTDTGQGIAEDRISHVLEPFYKAGNSPNSGAHRGAGLGLTIVINIVGLHGGSMTIQSRLGEGTSVLIRFPAAPVPVAP